MTSQIDRVEELTRDAVRDVFQSMVTIEFTSEEPSPLGPDAMGQIAASVGFIGEANGIVYLYTRVEFAKILTGRMLGISESELEGEEMVNDAFGELSNMVGGHVKSHLCDSGNSCTLTIPSIIRGRGLSIENVAHVSRRVLGFRHGTHQLLVELLVKESVA